VYNALARENLWALQQSMDVLKALIVGQNRVFVAGAVEETAHATDFGSGRKMR
jgi:hypothetical protein